MTRKVIIRGHIFDYEEKAPFMPSGVSVLGAIEYDEDRDLVRCHECGEWLEIISQHALTLHKISPRDYKIKHGLRLKTSLASRRVAQRRSEVLKEINRERGGVPVQISAAVRHQAISQLKNRPRKKRLPNRWEERNERGSCHAQIIFRIQQISAKLGHTPTHSELKSNGLLPDSIRQAFRVTSLNKVIQMAGLTPNLKGKAFSYSGETIIELFQVFQVRKGREPRTEDLGKNGLPSFNTVSRHFGSLEMARKQAGMGDLLGERMPWPEEYFGIKAESAIEQSRKATA